MPTEPLMDSESPLDDVVTVLVAGDPEWGEPLRAPGHAVHLVAHVTTGTAATTRVLEEIPDVLLLDVAIGDPDARAVCRRVREWVPATRVVAVAHRDDETAYTTLVAGAAAVIRSDTAPDDLVTAVRAVGRGESLLLPRTARRLLHDIDAWAARAADPIHPPPTLTATEREVLHRLGEGETSETIAASHAVTPHLVDLHAGFAVAKLHRYVLGAERIAADGRTSAG